METWLHRTAWDHHDDMSAQEIAAWRVRWPNFSPAELASGVAVKKGEAPRKGPLKIHVATLDMLQALRTQLGVPMIILSSFRTPEYNRHVGGAAGSMHLLAQAYDIAVVNIDPATLEAAARKVGFTGFGYYPDQNFLHIDTGLPRSWGVPFPPRDERFAVEKPMTVEGVTTPALGTVTAVTTTAAAVKTQADKAADLFGLPAQWVFYAGIAAIGGAIAYTLVRRVVRRWQARKARH